MSKNSLMHKCMQLSDPVHQIGDTVIRIFIRNFVRSFT